MAHPRPESGPTGPATGPGIDGPALARALIGGWTALREQTDALNAINVFPVPDGDTGTNMSLTMRAAVDEIERGGDATLADVTRAAAHGTLMGAKGNSGVILSQIVGAFDGAAEDGTIDARALAGALERGRTAAYRVVSNPREGTILTAITAAAEAAAARAADGATIDATLAAAVDAAHDAVRRTPELLPLLKEAGVVDAGAQGLYLMLDGMLRALRGQAPATYAERLGAIDAQWLAATTRAHTDGERSGFCTEFIIHGDALDAGAVRERFGAMGNSLLVVGGGEFVRVHLHTHEPEAAFTAGRGLGTLSDEKAEDMEAQFRRLAGQQPAAPRRTGMAVVAVGAGAGIEALLRSIGAAGVVHGGQTMNPSAGDIRAAIEATGTAEVIVLPDNKNVIMAARQAAAGLPVRIHVVPSRSIPQGVAALVAMNAEAPFEENVTAMEQAIATVRTGEVTFAARPSRIHGLEITQGQPIGLVDGDLVVAEHAVADAVRACIRRMVAGRAAPLVTLYAGEAVSREDARELADSIREELHVDVEVVDGGQPHYPYLIGVE